MNQLTAFDREFDGFVTAVINAFLLQLHDSLAKALIEDVIRDKSIEHAVHALDVRAFIGRIAELFAIDTAIDFMAADMTLEDLWNGIEDELRRLGDEQIDAPHEDVGAIDGFEDVIIFDEIDAFDILHILTKSEQFTVFIEEFGRIS